MKGLIFTYKQVIRRALGRVGYTIRDVGRGVGGVDLLHDARVLLAGVRAPILFDVGANVGQTTQAMLATFDSPRITAFEPSPATFQALRRAIGDRRGVQFEPIAMGASEGELPFHVTRDHSVNDSLLAPAWNAGGTVLTVKVDTVDGFCSRRGIDRVDLLKIDAQGYDLQVLQGARGMLEARRVTLFCCETNFQRLYDGQATLPELLDFAGTAGYELVGFYEQSYVDDRLSYSDALFYAGRATEARNA